MSRPDLAFNSLENLISDLQLLKAGHSQDGNWTLPQASWHCRIAIERCLKPVAPDTQSTPEQTEAREIRLEPMLATGKMPSGRPMPPGVDPLKDAPQPVGNDQIDQFTADLNKLAVSPLKQVIFGAVGLISIDQFRRFVLIHSANHLQHFTPAS